MNTIKRALVISTLFFAVMAGTSHAQQHDVRLVFGKTVDLGPLHDWLGKAPKDRGPQPLPPWHECHIVEMPIPTVGVDQSILNPGDAGPARKVYLAHLDYSLRTPFVVVYEMNHEIPELERQIRQDQAIVARLAGNNIPKFKAERDAAIGRLNENIPSRLDCIHKRDVAIHQCAIARTVPFYAMFSGTTQTDPSNGDKLEYWECGLKKPGNATK